MLQISSKVILSFIVPGTQAAFAICKAREIKAKEFLCFKKLPALQLFKFINPSQQRIAWFQSDFNTRDELRSSELTHRFWSKKWSAVFI